MNVLANLWGKGNSLDQSFDKLLESSGLTLFSCLLTTALCLVVYFLASQPDNIIKWTPYLATSNADDDIYVTADILRLRNTDRIEKKVILVGDSSIREAIYEDQLQEAIASAGLDFQVMDLRTGGQTLLESLAVVDKLPPTDKSVVVTGISLRKFMITNQHIENAKNGIRIGFNSESVDNYLQQSGIDVSRKIGIYGFDNFRFLAPRIIDFAKRPFSEPIPLVRHQSSVRPIPSDKRFKELENYFLRGIDFNKSSYRSQTNEGRSYLSYFTKLIVTKNDNRKISREIPERKTSIPKSYLQ